MSVIDRNELKLINVEVILFCKLGILTSPPSIVAGIPHGNYDCMVLSSLLSHHEGVLINCLTLNRLVIGDFELIRRGSLGRWSIRSRGFLSFFGVCFCSWNNLVGNVLEQRSGNPNGIVSTVVELQLHKEIVVRLQWQCLGSNWTDFQGKIVHRWGWGVWCQWSQKCRKDWNQDYCQDGCYGWFEGEGSNCWGWSSINHCWRSRWEWGRGTIQDLDRFMSTKLYVEGC